jgi:hypothetical protein
MVWPFTSSSKGKQLEPLVVEEPAPHAGRSSFSSFRTRQRKSVEPVSIELMESPRSTTAPSLQSSHLDSGYSESLMQPEADFEAPSADAAKKSTSGSRWKLPGVGGRKRGDSNVSLDLFSRGKKAQSGSAQGAAATTATSASTEA